MDILKETRLDRSKVTHIKIKDSFKGVDTGWGIKQYKFCEAKYGKFLWIWKYLKSEEGFWRDGKQYSSCLSPMYTVEEVSKCPNYSVQDGWVHTKVSVKVFVGEKLIKELFFDDLDSAKRFSDINFPNVNFII